MNAPIGPIANPAIRHVPDLRRALVGLIALLTLFASADSVRGGGLPSQDDNAVRRLVNGLSELEPDPASVAKVSGLTLIRDAARMDLDWGTLALAKAVDGQTVAAYFVGKGRFRVRPEPEVERAQLNRLFKKPEIDRGFESLFMLFADSTAEELRAQLDFKRADFRDRWVTSQENLKALVDSSARMLNWSVGRSFLEKRRNGYFYAVLSNPGGSRMAVMIDPYRTEEVSLWHVFQGGASIERLSQFRLKGQSSDTLHRDWIRSVEVHGYSANLRVSEVLQPRYEILLMLTVLEDSLRFLPFHLEGVEGAVDSVCFADGAPLNVYESPEHGQLWLDLGRSVPAGTKLGLRFFYLGQRLYDPLNGTDPAPPTAWYPIHDFSQRSTFRMAAYCPSDLRVIGTGEAVDMSEQGAEFVTRWRTREPVVRAGWRVGRFSKQSVSVDRGPLLWVLLKSVMRDNTDFDVSSRPPLEQGSEATAIAGAALARYLAFYANCFGNLKIDTLYAVRTAMAGVESYPGLVGVCRSTLLTPDPFGDLELLRAQEAAYQWWGFDVAGATYHDDWLRAGLSRFSAMWCMETLDQDDRQYRAWLGRLQKDILDGGDAGATWLGRRVATHRTSTADYSVAISARSVWILHMLRTMLAEGHGKEEGRLAALLRELYETHRGGTVTTREFRTLVEKHAGMPMQWFFDQWLLRTAIPTYRYAWSPAQGEGGGVQVTLRVQQAGVPEGFRALLPVTLELGDGSKRHERVWIDKSMTEVVVRSLPSAPRQVRLNDPPGVLCKVEE